MRKNLVQHGRLQLTIIVFFHFLPRKTNLYMKTFRHSCKFKMEEGTNTSDANSESNQTKEPKVKEDVQKPPQIPVVQVDKNSVAGKQGKDTRCGIGHCHPSWLSFFNSPKFLLAALCCFSLFHSFIVNGINNVNTSTLERRFHLSSSRVGWISSSYDAANAIFLLPVSFLGTRGNKPRWLSAAAAIASLGSLVYLSSHLLVGEYNYTSETKAEGCVSIQGYSQNETSFATSVCQESSLSNYLYLFIGGQALHGIGGTILYTIGFTYLDENVSHRNSPLYIGIFYAASGLGPAIGYLVGGEFLHMYVDVGKVSDPGITKEDPRWVGAWWMGACISAVCMALSAVAILPFPPVFPRSETSKTDEKSVPRETKDIDTEKAAADTAKETGNQTSGGVVESIKEILKSLRLLLTNPTFMLVTIGACTHGLFISGFATYLPKILQSQFLLAPGKAAITTGLAAIPGVVGGLLFGGFVVRRKKLDIPGMLKFALIVGTVSTAGCVSLLSRCDETNLAGVYVPYTANETAPSMSSACNQDCGCTTESYEPVCGANNVQYFSPCHAGCENQTSLNGEKHFATCQCITGNETWAKPGVCKDKCVWFYPVVTFIFVIMFATFSAVPSVTAITLRSVSHTQRLLAVGVQGLLFRCLGTIPGPLLAGTIIDSACSIWQEKCGKTLSCWLYDPSLLSRNMFMYAIVSKVCTWLLFFVAYKTYKAPSEKADTTDESKDLQSAKL